jgi:hypothetical protein
MALWQILWFPAISSGCKSGLLFPPSFFLIFAGMGALQSPVVARQSPVGVRQPPDCKAVIQNSEVAQRSAGCQTCPFAGEGRVHGQVWQPYRTLAKTGEVL